MPQDLGRMGPYLSLIMLYRLIFAVPAVAGANANRLRMSHSESWPLCSHQTGDSVALAFKPPLFYRPELFSLYRPEISLLFHRELLFLCPPETSLLLRLENSSAFPSETSFPVPSGPFSVLPSGTSSALPPGSSFSVSGTSLALPSGNSCALPSGHGYGLEQTGYGRQYEPPMVNRSDDTLDPAGMSIFSGSSFLSIKNLLARRFLEENLALISSSHARSGLSNAAAESYLAPHPLSRT